MERILDFDVIVIGAGASGVFCSIQIAEANPNLKILILEKSETILHKVRISGGGRCNVTNGCEHNKQLLAGYPRGSKFLSHVFKQFNNKDTRKWFEDRGVPIKIEKDNRAFPISDSSDTIIELFKKLIDQYGITIRTKHEVINFEPDPFGYRVDIENKMVLHSKFIVLATGGAQREIQLDYFKKLNINTISPVPSLFTLKINDHKLRDLMGISVPNAIINLPKYQIKEQGPVLITHWGISGPAVLKFSAWSARVLNELNYSFELKINWLGEKNQELVSSKIVLFQKEHRNAKMINRNPFELPSRLWEYFISVASISFEKKYDEMSNKDLNKLVESLTNSTYSINGKTTYKEEFVTAGGVDLEEIDVHTMECKKFPNLYILGELLDIDGITGGYNFQNAWSGAFVAAQDIVRKTKY
jgi:hypothetical protein